MAKQILLNAFNMNCIGHINHGLWTHPRDTSTQYKTLDYWTNLARLLERGLFDGLFIADIVGTYDIYGQSLDVTLKEAIQLPVNDPLLLVSAMAAVTRHLGFGLTANLTYEAPYLFARRLSTLDHLSNGRVGWNIVTGYLDSAARAMGLAQQPEHDRRYDQADEYLQVLYKLLEGSWADDAVVADREHRVYATPDKVRKVQHQGEFYKVEGYHLCEPSPQRTPVLFQAGSSPRGLAFMRQPCRMRVHQWPGQGSHPRPGRQGSRGRPGRRPRPAGGQGVHGHHGDRCGHRATGPGQTCRVPAPRQRRSGGRALRRVHWHRLRRL